MGLLVNVYRTVEIQHADGTATPRDCTNAGWSSKYNTVCVTNVEGPFEPSIEFPAVMLVKHPTMNHAFLMSEKHLIERSQTMFGGNYGCSQDSRFDKAVRELLDSDITHGPVAIHDRMEGQ